MTYRIKDWQQFENNRTKSMKVMQWVPLPNKLDGFGYITLVDHPNGAQHFAAWIIMLEIASKQTPSAMRGTFPMAASGDDLPRALSRISRLPAPIFEEAIPRLLQVGWIEQVTDGCAETAGNPHLARAEGRKEGRKEGTEGKKETRSIDRSYDARDWPMTAVAIRRGNAPPDESPQWPMADDAFVGLVVEKSLDASGNLELDDETLADAVLTAAREHFPKQKKHGLFLTSVPGVIKAWARQHR